MADNFALKLWSQLNRNSVQHLRSWPDTPTISHFFLADLLHSSRNLGCDLSLKKMSPASHTMWYTVSHVRLAKNNTLAKPNAESSIDSRATFTPYQKAPCKSDAISLLKDTRGFWICLYTFYLSYISPAIHHQPKLKETKWNLHGSIDYAPKHPWDTISWISITGTHPSILAYSTTSWYITH